MMDDTRPKRHGWAPGQYLCKCTVPTCSIAKDKFGNRTFTGDKRAWMCADCAYAMPDPVDAPPVPLTGARQATPIEVETLMTVTASLAAAISLLERGGKKAAASDKMFEQMLADYRKSLNAARRVLRQS